MRASVRPHAHGARVQRGDVARAVAQQRQRLLGQRAEDELALGAVGQRLAGLGIDDLDEEVVLVDVRARRAPRGTGPPRPGPIDLREPVDVDGRQPERALDRGAHGRRSTARRRRRRPRARGRPGPRPCLAQRLADVQRVGRAWRTGPGRARSRSSVTWRSVKPPETGTTVAPSRSAPWWKPEPAGEEPVAVGVVHEHPRRARPPSPGSAPSPRSRCRGRAGCSRRPWPCRPCRWRRARARAPRAAPPAGRRGSARAGRPSSRTAAGAGRRGCGRPRAERTPAACRRSRVSGTASSRRATSPRRRSSCSSRRRSRGARSTSETAVACIPVALEVGDERGAEVAEGLLARVQRHVGCERRRAARRRRASCAGWRRR